MQQQFKLHFVVDPLCGWTYAAGPLMEQSLSIPNLLVQVHGGGMLTGDRRRPVTQEWRDFVRPHDLRIAKISGQTFGEAYYDKLLSDTSIVLDSTPATIAILSAQEIARLGVQMLNRVQYAYFGEGQKIFDIDTLIKLAVGLGIDQNSFKKAYVESEKRIPQHFNQTSELLRQINGQGFPSAALEVNGQYQPLDISRYYGKPQEWLEYLHSVNPSI
ncbi:MAG: DsbA family protein [Parashewanella sp.]